MGYFSKILRTLGLMGSPLKPVTGVEIIGRLVYVLLLIVSVWATAESFYTSFPNIPHLICYVVGLAPAALIALTLWGVISSFRQRRFILLLLASAFLLFFLGFSLLTNSHKFFIEMKMYDIRKSELEYASNQLQLIKKNSSSVAEGIIDDYGQMVSGHIKNYAQEVQNPMNCGHGPVADTLKRKVEESMPGSHFKLLSGYAKTGASCRQLAEAMSGVMIGELNDRLNDMRQNTLNMELCDEDRLSEQIIDNLNTIINEYFVTDQLEVKKILSKAHQHYELLHDCITKRLASRVSTVGSDDLDFEKNLEMPVASMVLEKFPELPAFIREHPQYNSAALMSVVIAMILDLGAIIVLFILMGKSED